MPRLAPIALASLMATACGGSPTYDVYGGGSWSVTLDEDGPLGAVAYDQDGATQDCLDAEDRAFCRSPKMTLANHTEGGSELESIAVSAYVPVASSQARPACMGNADLELIVYVSWFDGGGNHVMWFELHDPEQSAADPNADQGGAVSPSITGWVELPGDLAPTEVGSVDGTLELEGRNACSEQAGSTDMAVTWDFDPGVTAGVGFFGLE